MINFVAKKLKGEDYDPNAAPMILEKYGNVASAGSVIAFMKQKMIFSLEKWVLFVLLVQDTQYAH